MTNARMIRKNQGKTLRSVAQAAGVSIQFLADLECDRRSAKDETWCRIAEALDVTVPELRGDDHDKTADH